MILYLNLLKESLQYVKFVTHVFSLRRLVRHKDYLVPEKMNSLSYAGAGRCCSIFAASLRKPTSFLAEAAEEGSFAVAATNRDRW